MTGPHLSVEQARNRLILNARRTVADHAPAGDGRCRICRVPGCEARRAAQEYLDSVGDQGRTH
ncbi:hypothetical protein [Micromonospora sp. DT233]|uniref:hypothetical protein n=1 Tax=Micromonospora sp. DT233 TaxID=3393432 RepID=UPI003CEAC95B